MKFSKKKYVIIDDIVNDGIKVSDGFRSVVENLSEDGVFMKNIFDSFATNVIKSSKKLYYLTSEIANEFTDPLVSEKLFPLRNELRSTKGTILLPDKGLFNVFNSISYIIERTVEFDRFSICLYSLRGVELFISGNFIVDKFKAVSIVADDCEFYAGEKYVIDTTVTYVYNLLLFLQFAEIEVVEILGTENDKPVKIRISNEKYLSESSVPIEIINSNWFKSIIRKAAFRVSGHFRLQPYGVNNSLRKLIWISEFQKDGYIMPAKKQSYDSK